MVQDPSHLDNKNIPIFDPFNGPSISVQHLLFKIRSDSVSRSVPFSTAETFTKKTWRKDCVEAKTKAC